MLVISTRLVSESNIGMKLRLILSLILTLLFFQMVLAVAQHHKKPMRVLMELIIVLTFSKPIFDVYNVTSGKVQENHEMFEPLAELIIGKSCETIGKNKKGFG